MRSRMANGLVPAGFLLSFCSFAAIFALNAGGEADPSTKAHEAFKKAYPHTQVESVAGTGIADLSEVVTGGNILYFAPDGNYLFFGEIYTPKGKNLTAARREELAIIHLKNLPLDLGVKIGNGRNRVIEFTDPDCPFCRKVERFFKERRDVTRHVFFTPLVQLHPDSERKVAWILSSKNREKAYHEVMSGKHDKDRLPQPDKRAGELVAKHRQLSASMGVMGTPMFWVNGRIVRGADIPAIEKLLGEGGGEKSSR